jgi:hypothetical protein
MTKADRLTLIVAAMLTGQTAPGEQLIRQVVLLAGVALKRIEESCNSK